MKEIIEKVKLLWNIPKILHRLLKEKAEKDKRSVTQTGIIILEDYFKNQQDGKTD